MSDTSPTPSSSATAAPSRVDLPAGTYAVPGSAYLLVLDGPCGHLEKPAVPGSLLDLVTLSPIIPRGQHRQHGSPATPTTAFSGLNWLLVMAGLIMGSLGYHLWAEHHASPTPAPSPVIPTPRACADPTTCTGPSTNACAHSGSDPDTNPQPPTPPRSGLIGSDSRPRQCIPWICPPCPGKSNLLPGVAAPAVGRGVGGLRAGHRRQVHDHNLAEGSDTACGGARACAVQTVPGPLPGPVLSGRSCSVVKPNSPRWREDARCRKHGRFPRHARRSPPAWPRSGPRAHSFTFECCSLRFPFARNPSVRRTSPGPVNLAVYGPNPKVLGTDSSGKATDRLRAPGARQPDTRSTSCRGNLVAGTYYVVARSGDDVHLRARSASWSQCQDGSSSDEPVR